MTQKAPFQVLSFDLGGTKLAAGVVTSSGRVLAQVRVPAELKKGPTALIRQMTRLGKGLIGEYPKIDRIGIASAGPLDPVRGILLHPTNFSEGNWKRVPLVRALSRRMGLPATLENDAAAAILAEHWVGSARGVKNAIVLTLGTGLGTGILCNGKLVRAGDHLHTEAGHMIIRYGDQTAPCGCGNLGCAEAYLSARHFAERAARKLGLHPRKKTTPHELAGLARSGNVEALAAFSEYSEVLAVAINNLCKIFNPGVVILTGGFADTHDLFLVGAQRALKRLQNPPPELMVSRLKNCASLIGAAFGTLKK